ncbi:Hypothetical predicted protein [Cloeon dipterum]|uniref:Uncharacterized protein n=1 Tax=Cloeon dipterum TaxID=197152 RepID=A0A8S1DC23_9INSE|nr:Hypothetical predicted protein [Cloeon dipterum]
MGDMNLDIYWNAEPPLPKSTTAERFIDSFDSLGFAKLIKSATRSTNTSEKIIDLFLCDTPNLVSATEVTDIVRAKAARNLGFAARNLRGCTPRVKRVAYLTLVRPVMTFGLPAWHPTTQDNVNRLERVQKRAVHFIYGRNPPPANEQKIMPFPMLLRYNDLIFFKKCECGETDFNARARIIEGRVLRGDSGQHPRLQPPPTRSVFGQRAFSFRVVKPWNDLPPALKDCNAAQFPALLKQHMWQEF